MMMKIAACIGLATTGVAALNLKANRVENHVAAHTAFASETQVEDKILQNSAKNTGELSTGANSGVQQMNGFVIFLIVMLSLGGSVVLGYAIWVSLIASGYNLNFYSQSLLKVSESKSMKTALSTGRQGWFAPTAITLLTLIFSAAIGYAIYAGIEAAGGSKSSSLLKSTSEIVNKHSSFFQVAHKSLLALANHFSHGMKASGVGVVVAITVPIAAVGVYFLIWWILQVTNYSTRGWDSANSGFTWDSTNSGVTSQSLRKSLTEASKPATIARNFSKHVSKLFNSDDSQTMVLIFVPVGLTATGLLVWLIVYLAMYSSVVVVDAADKNARNSKNSN